MLNSILTIDVAVTSIINSLLPHSPFFDYFFSFFSLRGSSILIWLIIIVSIVFFEEKKHPGIQKRDKRFIFYFFISFLSAFLIVNLFIKNIVQRNRPTDFFVKQQLTQTQACPQDYSFPSGHAATAFAAAATLSYFDKKRKYFYYLIASLIGLSRIYLGCHFFFDVAGGGIIGYLIGKIIPRLKFISIKKLFEILF